MIEKIQSQGTILKLKQNFMWATPPQIPDDDENKDKGKGSKNVIKR